MINFRKCFLIPVSDSVFDSNFSLCGLMTSDKLINNKLFSACLGRPLWKKSHAFTISYKKKKDMLAYVFFM